MAFTADPRAADPRPGTGRRARFRPAGSLRQVRGAGAAARFDR
ncbi:Hypothetical protein I596_2547 [Dokdonella koreensis DS-123]|uniref:Uncharacterized protein n=1 Tax=Dokdonella koreensis DS-123 TaxID=1300342 RepID=A0A160DWD1_9GAMM|nr:Hypothetical protein I596_2547 [Dokdonella koreensis DS-123]